MPEKEPKIKRADKVCKVLLDRVQFVARTWTLQIPEIPGFRVCRDSFVRQQTAIRTYSRVRNFKNLKTCTTIYAQYWAAPPWLEPVKVTVVADDSKGVQRQELEAICGQFKWTRLLMAEIAFDFGEGSEVDRTFVLSHALFGRSKLVGGRLFKDLRYGTRKSSTMVRAYQKVETACYRVEIELHAAWLRSFEITQPRDLSKLAQLLCFSRINFVAIDWDALVDHVQRKDHPASALNDARSQAYSIHRVLTLLRHQIGLVNVQKFLKPLRTNAVVKRQLEVWAIRWRNSLDASP
jgi:hypothetical protein